MTKHTLFIAFCFALIAVVLEVFFFFLAVSLAGSYQYTSAQQATLDLLATAVKFFVPAFLTGLVFAAFWRTSISKGRTASQVCVAALPITFICTYGAIFYTQMVKNTNGDGSSNAMSILDVLIANIGQTVFVSLISGLFAFIAAQLTMLILKQPRG